MVDKNLTHIYPVIDRSGSISKHKNAYQEGFNGFITEQQKVPGKCMVTLAQFDTVYEVVYADRPIADVPPLVIVPRDGTALLDAIGRTIEVAGAALSALPENKRPGAVIVPIVTDGEENSSREFTWPMVSEMITEQTNKYGWLFVYVGANQDAIAVGSRLGFARGQTMTYDVRNTNEVFAAMSANTTAYRGATQSGLAPKDAAKVASFTEEQRQEALIGKDKTSQTSSTGGQK